MTVLCVLVRRDGWWMCRTRWAVAFSHDRETAMRMAGLEV